MALFPLTIRKNQLIITQAEWNALKVGQTFSFTKLDGTTVVKGEVTGKTTNVLMYWPK